MKNLILRPLFALFLKKIGIGSRNDLQHQVEAAFPVLLPRADRGWPVGLSDVGLVDVIVGKAGQQS